MTDHASGKPAARGSRPPFAPGHQLTQASGGRSARTVAVRAELLEAVARQDPHWPSFLSDSTYSAAVTAWARAEAVAELLWEYLAERDIGAALTALEESDEQTTVNPGGSGRKISTTRRTTAALDAWTRAQSAAAGHRQRLGLDPLSRARLGRDVSTAAAMQTAQIEQHAATGAAIRARRGVLSAPETASQLIDHTEHADEQGDDRDDR